MSVGLDIGSKTIKVVELAKVGQGFSLKAAGAVSFQGVQVDKLGEEKEIAQFASTLKKLFADARITSRRVVLSIPESLAFTRTVKFPLLTNEEIESAVKWEAEEYIPIPVRDAVVRHQILERQETGNPPQVLVQVIAVPRLLIDKYVNVASAAGLEVIAIETELLALSRTWGAPDKTTMLADFGARSTNVGIIKNSQLFLSRSIPTAGEAFSRAVSMGLGVTPIQAEEYKATYGLTEGQLEGKVGRALKPVLSVISDELKKTMSYFQLETRNEPPRSIILSGGSAGLPGMAAELTRLLNMEVQVGNPFTRPDIAIDPDSAKSLANFAPIYAVSVGLALRED
mgnify:CR=1 FL=1